MRYNQNLIIVFVAFPIICIHSNRKLTMDTWSHMLIIWLHIFTQVFWLIGAYEPIIESTLKI